jgi:sulfinoalanine decarboxylase/sulfinoalanine decarboxylase/aspartate 1-decarboxylase
MESLAGEVKLGDEKQQVNEELLLKQITDLVINQRLLSGKANAEDRVVKFVHPEELKVTIKFVSRRLLLGSPFY